MRRRTVERSSSINSQSVRPRRAGHDVDASTAAAAAAAASLT